jgi:hypothetical protein
MVSQLGFKDTVEILRSSDGHKTVGVGEFGKYTNLVGVLKLLGGESHGQYARIVVGMRSYWENIYR